MLLRYHSAVCHFSQTSLSSVFTLIPSILYHLRREWFIGRIAQELVLTGRIVQGDGHERIMDDPVFGAIAAR